VLDVKTGSGAFMKRLPEAENLARMMVETGRRMGKKTVALITDMDQPLGRAVGNSLEVAECLEILGGARHPMSEDLRSLSLELSAWMFHLGRRVTGIENGRKLAEEMIANGKALAKFREVCRLQGAAGPIHLPVAKFTAPFAAAAGGFIARIRCEQVGLAGLVLGAGRNRWDDSIDHAAGLELRKKLGDAVQTGEPIATLHYNDPARLPEALRLLQAAYAIGPRPPAEARTIVKTIIEDIPTAIATS